MFLIDLLNKLNDLAKELPIVGSTFSITLAAGIAGAVWKGPGFIKNLFNKVFGVSITINNSGEGNSDQNFNNFLKWFEELDCLKISKSFGVNNGQWTPYSSIGPGIGNHWMFYNKRLYIVKINPLQSTGTVKEKYEAKIFTLSFNKNILLSLFEEFSVKKPENGRSIYIANGATGGWSYIGAAPVRNLNTVIINEESKNTIVETIDKFLANRTWYKERGIPYKLVVLLYGPPGTGKTSLIKAIASEYDRDLSAINIATMTNKSFVEAFNNVPPNCIITVEDIESSKGVQKRETSVVNNNVSIAMDDELSIVTVLNTLDGLKELNGEIIFITTNIVEKLSSAFIRPGRVDKKIFIPAFTKIEIDNYIRLMYPNANYLVPDNLLITGAELQELVIEHKWSFEDFKVGLTKYIN